jgi:hypothetical protein
MLEKIQSLFIMRNGFVVYILSIDLDIVGGLV